MRNPRTLCAAAMLAGAVSMSTHAQNMSCAMSLSPEEVRIVLDRIAAGVYDPAGGVAGKGDIEYFIPIAFHIVRQSDGSGGLSLLDLQQSLEDLNASFAQVGMTYCQVSEVDFIDSDSFYFDIDSIGDINELRTTNVVPNAVNVYFTETLPGLCGISSFTFSAVQGIVMNNFCTAEQDNPSTLAHEVGHYFDLFHTHETGFGIECTDDSNCDEAGDLLCDTPADPGLGGEVSVDCDYIGDDAPVCPLIGGTGYNPDTTNFMSLSLKHCRVNFSPMQIDKMRTTLIELRPELALESCPDAFVPHRGIELISRAEDGSLPDDHSSSPDVSADGRYVVFQSIANDIHPHDSTPFRDIYLRDRDTGELTLLTVNIDGEQAIGQSWDPAISDDARYVVFRTDAQNLYAPGAGPAGIADQIVLLDRETGLFERLTNDLMGQEINADANVFSISSDAQIVAYVTSANDIVADDTGSQFGFDSRDVFVFERATGQTERVNISTEGEEADAITTWTWDRVDVSDDGRYVVFASYATNLVPDDTNNEPDVFVRDRELNTTTRISVAFDGGNANFGSNYPQITTDGSLIFFTSGATNLLESMDENGFLSDVYIYDMATGQIDITALTNDGEQGNGLSQWPDISNDGRFVAFRSFATNYDPDTPPSLTMDVFLHDRVADTTVLASPRGSSFDTGNADEPAISEDGRVVTFDSIAGNFVPGDLNQASDVFVYNNVNFSPADYTGDGVVGPGDLAILLGNWGACKRVVDCTIDLTGDGVIGPEDLAILLGDWG